LGHDELDEREGDVSALVTVGVSGWTAPAPGNPGEAVTALERGDVLFLSNLAFSIEPDEAPLFSPRILSSSKNAHFDPLSGRLGGTTVTGDDLARLRGLMTRFSGLTAALVHHLLPHYRGRLAQARSSFRPAEIAGRATSWRKDDTRLHIDSFPASPVQGRRILRVFTNVNPAGRPRSWRIGEDFEPLARRFAPSLSFPWPGSATLRHMLHLTKSRRSAYDALMLSLHDHMKQDLTYQQQAPQTAIDFPAGTTWVAFTDQVSHAAMAGQYQLEQTFLLPVGAMVDEARSPLRVLERLKGRRLV
jgi:hypothetical protein